MTGTVADASGAPISGATVQIVSLETNRLREAVTDTLGGFTISNLPPGDYRIQAEREGYSRYVREVTLRLDDDHGVLARALLPTLPPRPGTGPRWVYRADPPGVTFVRLVDRGVAKTPRFRLRLDAARWFHGADATDPAARTRLTITLGGQCFTRAVTRKID